MRLKLINSKRALIIYLEGEIDHHSVIALRENMDKEIKRTTARTFILDLSGITFMDSSGIGMIMGRYKLISMMNGSVIISCASDRIGKLLRMSGVDKLVKMCETEDAALNMAEEG